MNAFGYAIRRLARSIGLRNERGRMVVAQRETQLLNEAEDLLGGMAWRDVGDIEELGEEYWQIIELEKRQDQLSEEIKALEIENDKLAIKHEDLEEQMEGGISSLIERKTAKMEEAIALMNEIEEATRTAELTRKRFTGLKMKLKVIAEDSEQSEEVETVRTHLDELKADYGTQAATISEKNVQLKAIELEVTELEERIDLSREEARKALSVVMNEVGKSSKDVARYSAKIGALEKAKRDLAFRVGTFLSNNTESRDVEVRKVIRKHRGLIGRINFYRASIRYNKILAGREVD